MALDFQTIPRRIGSGFGVYGEGDSADQVRSRVLEFVFGSGLVAVFAVGLRGIGSELAPFPWAARIFSGGSVFFVAAASIAGGYGLFVETMKSEPLEEVSTSINVVVWAVGLWSLRWSFAQFDSRLARIMGATPLWIACGIFGVQAAMPPRRGGPLHASAPINGGSPHQPAHPAIVPFTASSGSQSV